MISTVIPAYYYRDVTKAAVTQNETQLIYAIVYNAFLVSQEVTKLLTKAGVIVNPKNVRFQITKEFLIHLIKPSKKNTYTTVKSLSCENLNKVKTFFEETHLFPSYFFNSHQITYQEESNSACKKVSDPLQIGYQQHNDWFKKITLSPFEQNMPCFVYAIVRSGFDYKDFINFVCAAPCDKWNDPFDYTGFLKSKKMEKAPLPLQSGDILVYYDTYNQIVHAALVCKNPEKVYAKFGDKTPFAYEHDVEETPLPYGKKFQIFRKNKI